MTEFVMRNLKLYLDNQDHHAGKSSLGIASEEGHLAAISKILAIIERECNPVAIVEQVAAYARENPVIKDGEDSDNCKNASIQIICQEFLDFARGNRF